jgi:hypothetical protein
MKLYDIPMEFAQLEEALIEGQGELTPELEARFDEFLRAGKDKLEAGAMVVRSLEMEAEACNQEADRLQTRAESATKNAERLKALVLRAVDLAFSGKVKTDLFTIWGQTSAPVVKFDLDPETTLEDLEKHFPTLVRVKRELNASALKDMHKAGEEIPEGLIVTTLPGTRFLRIK